MGLIEDVSLYDGKHAAVLIRMVVDMHHDWQVCGHARVVPHVREQHLGVHELIDVQNPPCHGRVLVDSV